MKKYIIFFLSIIVLLGTILVYNTVNVKKQKELNFSESGYILNNLSDRYYFYEDETYTKSYDGKIVFNDTEGEKITIEKENFVHYTSGNTEALKESVLLDLNNIDLNPIVYYNINANKEIKKTSDRYTIKNLKSDIQFDKAIWKISDNKYLILAENIKINLSSGIQKEVKDYIEIEYSDNEIVNLYNQEISNQTISSDSYIELADNIKLNLGDKIVTKDGQIKMSLDNMIINSNDNVNIVDLADYEEKNNEENNTTENNETEDGKTNGSVVVGGNNQQSTTNNSTTLINGSSDNGNDDGDEEEFDPSEIDYPKDSNETKVDETKKLSEPIFKVENIDISANKLEAKISITDKDELLSQDDDIIYQIRNDKTGKIMLRETADVVDMKFSVNKENLVPNTQYSLTVSAKYVIDDTMYSKNFVYRTFVTSSVGVEIVKDMFTSDSMSFEAVIDRNSLMESAKVSIYDYYADVNNSGNAKATVNINKEMKTIVFNGLDSNKPYKIKLYDIIYDNVKISWTDEFEYTTLKKVADFTADSYTDKKNGNFNLYASNISDSDGAIQSYEYCLYEVASNGTIGEICYRNKKDTTEEIVSVDYNKDSDSPVVAEKTYVLKIVATMYDNEKYFEVVKDGVALLSMPPKAMPTVSWEEIGLGATYIKGNIKINDEQKAIDNNKNIKIEYKNSMGETAIYDDKLYGRDQDGNITINIDMSNLKAKDTYVFNVYATINIGEKDENGASITRENVLIGTIRITTKEYTSVKAMYSMPPPDTTKKFSLKLKLDSLNTADTESLDNLSSVTIVVQASDRYSINNTNKAEKVINRSNYKSYNESAESFKDLINQKGIDINSTSMGLEESSDTCFTIGATMMYDSTTYKNLIPVINDPTNLELQLSNDLYVKGNETYTAAWVTVDTSETISDKKPPKAIEILNDKDAGDHKNDNLNDDTIVGYNITADFKRESKPTTAIVYYVYNEDDEEILNSGELEYSGKTIPSYKVFFSDTEEKMKRGNKYKFGYKVIYADGTKEASKGTTEKIPLKQEPVITMYAKESYVDDENGNVLKYVYSINDPDKAIVGDDTMDKLTINGEEILVARDSNNAEIEFKHLVKNREYIIEYKYSLIEGENNFQTKKVGSIKFSPIVEIGEDELNQYIYCVEDVNKYESEQIIRIIFGQKQYSDIDILSRVAMVDMTFEIAGTYKKEFKNQKLTYDNSKYYIDFDLSEDENQALMDLIAMGANNPEITYKIKYEMYYNTGKVGFNGKIDNNDTQEEYVAYVNDNGEYLDLNENKWDSSIIGKAYKKTGIEFKKSNVISNIKLSSGADRSITFAYGESSLKYSDVNVQQKHFLTSSGTTQDLPVNKKIVPSIQVKNTSVTTGSAYFNIKTFNVNKYNDVSEDKFDRLNFEVYKINNKTGKEEIYDQYTIYKEVVKDGKTVYEEYNGTDTDMGIGNYLIGNLEARASYVMKIAYVPGKYFFDRDVRRTGVKYSFNTGRKVDISDINIEYSATKFSDRNLDITYKIVDGQQVDGDQKFYDSIKCEFYNSRGILQSSVLVGKNKENTLIDRYFSIGIGPYNNQFMEGSQNGQNVFKFGEKYKLRMIPMVNNSELEYIEKEFTIQALDDCTTGWRFTRLDNDDGSNSIRINTTIKDLDCVIVNGEIKIEAYYYDETGKEISQKIYNSNGEEVTKLVLEGKNITNEKMYINNVAFSKTYYFKYSITIKKDNNLNIPDPNEILCTINAINNEADVDKGIVSLENSAKNDLYTTVMQFSNSYHLKNINLIQYTIYEYEKKDISSDSTLWKTGVLKIGQEDGIQWVDFESKTGDTYYKLNLPFEFNQNRGYLITLALYNTDYGIVYGNDIQRINNSKYGDTVEIFNVYK